MESLRENGRKNNILMATIFLSILLFPLICDAREKCSMYPDYNRGNIPGAITIDAYQFNRIMWHWHFAEVFMKRKQYRRANQEFLKTMGALGDCQIRDGFGSCKDTETVADESEIAGNVEGAALARQYEIRERFATCMRDFLVHDEMCNVENYMCAKMDSR